MSALYTIGHSNHPAENFIELLLRHDITAVCDVRSQPYSKFNPQFNRENIQKDLKQSNIAYVFLGRELGPRSDDPACYIDGQVQYHLLAQTDLFQEGLERLLKGMQFYRIAMMCAEKDPIMCHRMILVCRHLRQEVDEIRHILEDGRIEELADSEERLLRVLKIPPLQLFDSTEDLIIRAYDMQGEKIAYSINNKEENGALESTENL
ncbi:MAG: DUF488 domain-containing protein [Deltaproteobacteria bacterium]|nr:DUF488 domain-containing protein [Deltaproteobacteria bacterium]